MRPLIEGRIAQILSEQYVVISVGARDGVAVGMTFVVLAQGDLVKDPKSGEDLGRWEMPKGHLHVTHVQDRMAMCEGIRLRAAQAGDATEGEVLSAAMISHSMRPETWREKSASALVVNKSQMTGVPQIGPITVGDLVREVRSVAPDAAAGPS